MINENDIEFIDRFIRGELDPGEKLDFEKRVRNDLDFAKEVRLQQKVIKGIDAYGAHQFLSNMKTEMEGWKSQGHQAYKPPNMVGQVILKVVIGLGVAAGAYFGYKALFDKEDNKPKEETVPSASLEDSLHSVEGLEQTAPQQGEAPRSEPMEEDSLFQVTSEHTDDAEITLNVKDPSTFSIKKLGQDEKGVYTYEIKSDGDTRTVRTTQGNLDQMLMRKANEAKVPVQTGNNE